MSLVAVDGAADGLKELSLLTYNVGLLRLRLFCGCCEVFSNPPFALQRLPHIPDVLKSTGADVIAIQECYEEAHASFLTESLKAHYPYSARKQSGGCLKFHNGLLFLSKYPIDCSELKPYKKVAALERYLATKSSLVVKVSIPGLGKVTFVNMHTTAGGTADPEHPGSDLDRQDELREAIEICSCSQTATAVEAEAEVGIIIGDLNCGPEASPDNFQYVLNHGYRDTYQEAVAAQRLLPGPQFTWDPANYLNQIGPHAQCPGQRCDHVLLPCEKPTTTTSPTPTVVAAKETTVPAVVAEEATSLVAVEKEEAAADLGVQTSPLVAAAAVADKIPTGAVVMSQWEVASAQVLFSEKIADIGNGKMSTLSDHHGLLIKLRKKTQ